MRGPYYDIFYRNPKQITNTFLHKYNIVEEMVLDQNSKHSLPSRIRYYELILRFMATRSIIVLRSIYCILYYTVDSRFKPSIIRNLQ